MLKKSALSAALLLFLNMTHAETCPTIHEIQTEVFKQKGWKVFNLNSGEPLTAAEWRSIKSHVKHFSMAQWSPTAPEGSAQCYYKDAKSEFELDVYFVKNTFAPDKTRGNWRTVGYNISQCDAGVADCHFEDHP